MSSAISTVVNFMIDPHSMFFVKNKPDAELQHIFDEISKGYDLVLACDASYKHGIASIGITDGRERWHFRVDNYLGHILAELIAILQALRLSLKEFEYPRRLLIATDCRSILTGLETARKNGRVTQASAAIDFGLSWFYEACDVTLLWVPGHRGLTLNVIADDNARDARQLPEDIEAILPCALRNRETRWRRREICDLVECGENSEVARHRNADQMLFEMQVGQSFLNADLDGPPEYPQFAWCELCLEPNAVGKAQTFEHIFFDCEALVGERTGLRGEFAKVGLPFRKEVIFDGYCIDATASFIDAVKARKQLFIA